RHDKAQQRADQGDRRGAVAVADQGDLAVRRQLGVKQHEERGQDAAEGEIDDEVGKGRERGAEAGHVIHSLVQEGRQSSTSESALQPAGYSTALLRNKAPTLTLPRLRGRESTAASP